MEPELTRTEAIQHLRAKWGLIYSPGTVANWAVTKSGPAFVRRSGRTYYAIDALDRFAIQRLGPVLTALAGDAHRQEETAP
jgi:hypothetical protein